MATEPVCSPQRVWLRCVTVMLVSDVMTSSGGDGWASKVEGAQMRDLWSPRGTVCIDPLYQNHRDNTG